MPLPLWALGLKEYITKPSHIGLLKHSTCYSFLHGEVNCNHDKYKIGTQVKYWRTVNQKKTIWKQFFGVHIILPFLKDKQVCIVLRCMGLFVFTERIRSLWNVIICRALELQQFQSWYFDLYLSVLRIPLHIEYLLRKCQKMLRVISKIVETKIHLIIFLWNLVTQTIIFKIKILTVASRPSNADRKTFIPCY